MFEVIEHERTGCGDCLPYCPEPGALTHYEQSDLARKMSASFKNRQRTGRRYRE